ncbi:hypothetical protein D4R42_00500 [bacterium]|nr:MAG: hypothetical protein D4R42_00500 [bacterium]
MKKSKKILLILAIFFNIVAIIFVVLNIFGFLNYSHKRLGDIIIMIVLGNLLFKAWSFIDK